MKKSTWPAPVVDIVSPVPTQVWNNVLESDPGATPQQTSEYSTAVRQAVGGRDASRLYVLADGRRLLLPLVRHSPFPGLHVDSDYPRGYGQGGLLADGGLRPNDVCIVVDDLRGSSSVSTSINGHHHTAQYWKVGCGNGVVEIRRRVEVVDLRDGFDKLWRKGFAGGVRRNIAKAERAGVRIERDTTGRLLPAFYEIYLAWAAERSARSALPPRLALLSARHRESYRKLSSVVDQLAGRCRVWVAWFEDRPVACSISMVHGQHALGWRGYSIRSVAGPVAANTAVSVAEIKDAAESGCHYFDLGQSSDLPGLLTFKKSLGALPQEVVDLRIEPPVVTRLWTARERGRSALETAVTERSLRALRSGRP